MTIASPWALSLQPASFNGIPFVVSQSSVTVGRRVAVHEYPYRDLPYIEDLGKARQQITFSGFLVGDDVYDQRDDLVDACDQVGPGTLVHPSLGSLNANLISASFGESTDGGRTVGLQLNFLVSGDVLYPSLYPDQSTDTQDEVDDDADDADDSAASDFFSDVGSAISTGVTAVQGVVSTVQGYASEVVGVVGDATRAVNSVMGVATLFTGNPNISFGRYAAGNLSAVNTAVLAPISTGLSVVARTEAGVSALLSAACTARTLVSNAADDAVSLADAL